ncbi:helix-turn-helix domain-containing protein [Dactylosporangium aurantiacum]|uniref:Helix-turn-helix domain-containing protein n=1 Tax=Dactylosporangium aurantiacum TaxID=35754 RepID=A0A9Q9IM17_9ACTN|nr:MarR family winged helix-turn-helix transcriptional regulator [Dactylosporangium aurantiacum]MDG6108787.1 MarR family winged helix-turn-helix transcriptional regulator [Dactylosporangium aurantiacum]UWZ55804.1 helix-turn-helix domain-containing protein [Dactylosporangium aurantiacum]
MEHLSLTPATQAILDALTELGQGNVHELADKAGKARSTTDKAIKTLADAGLIVAVDTDADPAEGTPTRWTLANPADDIEAQPDYPADTVDVDSDFGDADHAGGDEYADPDPDADFPTDQLDAEYASDDHGGSQELTGHSDDAIDGNGGSYDQDAANDGDDQDEGGTYEADTDDGDSDDTEADGDGADTDGADTGDADTGDAGEENASGSTAVQPSRPGDRKVMAIKAVLGDYGDDGATLDVIVQESGIGIATATRLLVAMEQANAARRLPQEAGNSTPERWIAGPTKASEVDPNPAPARCPLCFQVIRGLADASSAATAVLPLVRPDGTLHVVASDGTTHVVTLPKQTPPRPQGATTTVSRRTDSTANGDGNQPFGRGELERLTFEYLAARPGEPLTPQEIATGIGAALGRTVSSGAVRNNCTKLGSTGRVVLVSDAPLTFTFPKTDDAEQS